MSCKGRDKGQRWIRALKGCKKGKKREDLQITYEFTDLLWHARRDSNPQLSEPETVMQKTQSPLISMEI